MTAPAKISLLPRIIVLGDVVTDIIVQQAEKLVKASDTPSTIAIRAGGSAANLASWLATTGLEVHFIGRVGYDPFGNFQQAELKKYGVIPHLSFDSLLPTGTIVVLVEPDNGERHMLSDRGANRNLSPEDIPWGLFSPGSNSCFHLSGYSLLEFQTREVALSVLSRARQNNLRTSVDPSSTSLLREIGSAQFLEWTRGADLCFPNLEEGQLLSGKEEPEEIARFLTDYYGEVVLKLGGSGAIWAKRDKETLKVDAFPAQVVDCTGAGDTFAAGFLSEWLKGKPVFEALTKGAELAALVVAQPGARPEPKVK